MTVAKRKRRQQKWQADHAGCVLAGVVFTKSVSDTYFGVATKRLKSKSEWDWKLDHYSCGPFSSRQAAVEDAMKYLAAPKCPERRPLSKAGQQCRLSKGE